MAHGIPSGHVIVFPVQPSCPQTMLQLPPLQFVQPFGQPIAVVGNGALQPPSFVVLSLSTSLPTSAVATSNEASAGGGVTSLVVAGPTSSPRKSRPHDVNVASVPI